MAITSPHGGPSQWPDAGQIREIDVSKQAGALRYLRIADYLLVILCGSWLLSLLVQLIVDPELRRGWDLVFVLGTIAILSFSTYTGCRHVGVIDPRVWRGYMVVFPLLLILCGVIGASQVPTILTDPQAFATLFNMLLIAALTIPGFVSVLRLSRTRIASLDVPLVDLLHNLTSRAGLNALNATGIKRVNARRGIAIGVCGGIILLVTTLISSPLMTVSGGRAAYSLQQGNVLGFFLFIRARRYFQVSADSLLSVDKRRPILFLRSFEDDERAQYMASERSVLDFSLETRLANHFAYFGPFVAVGSPRDTIPIPGAARVILADNEWQSRVFSWLSSASIIIMYSGKSHWVNWELAKIIETGRVPQLILMIPEVKERRRAKRHQEIATRLEHVRDAFANSKWSADITALRRPEEVRAILFREDGSMVVIRSGPRNRDSYHLAALVAHDLILNQATG